MRRRTTPRWSSSKCCTIACFSCAVITTKLHASPALLPGTHTTKVTSRPSATPAGLIRIPIPVTNRTWVPAELPAYTACTLALNTSSRWAAALFSAFSLPRAFGSAFSSIAASPSNVVLLSWKSCGHAKYQHLHLKDGWQRRRPARACISARGHGESGIPTPSTA
jgi:hypothetical protein